MTPREPMPCVGCGKPSGRWTDDVTHPTLAQIETKEVSCCYGPVYGWYCCVTRGELRELGPSQAPTPSHWEA